MLNTPLISDRYTQWLENRADANTKEALQEFTLALQAGTIQLPSQQTTQPQLAGGINYCPNSDYSYSQLAVTTPGTLPGDAGDTNQECYRWYRQLQTDDLTLDAAHALKAVGHSLYAANEGVDGTIPIWDRVRGELKWGGDALPLWDVAVNLYNNSVQAGKRWYVRFVLGADTADIVPDDLEMYVGFWHKKSGSEGWIEGVDFDLSYQIIGVKGTKELNYLCVAYNDAGGILYSQILNVPDAPDTFDTAVDVADNSSNYPRINFTNASGSGFIQFKLYREDVAAGTIFQIADLRNINDFQFDDKGKRVNMASPLPAFPTGPEDKPQAKALSQNLFVGANGGALIINDFTIQVPTGYDISQTLPFSQFLRAGFTRTTTVNREIRLDRIYAGPTFNQYSDSPFDPIGIIPAAAPSSGPTIGGGGDTPPDPGTGLCIRTDTPVLRLDYDLKHEWVPFKDVPGGDLLENGIEERNIVKKKQVGKTKVLYFVYFANGCWVPCNRAHRFRINKQGATVRAMSLSIGDQVWGWHKGEEVTTHVTKITKRLFKQWQDIGTFSLVGEESGGDHFYIAGFSDNDSGVFNKNRKNDAFEIT